MKVRNNLKREDLVYQKKGEDYIIAPHITSYKLIRDTGLKHLKVFLKRDELFLYNEHLGLYEDITDLELKLIIFSLLAEVVGENLVYPDYVSKILSSLKMNPKVATKGLPVLEPGDIVMTNGIYDLEKQEFNSWSPDMFRTSGVSYDYTKQATCPEFLKFLIENEGSKAGFASGLAYKQKIECKQVHPDCYPNKPL